jgi:DNA repair exonuclease SbcCD nuclease subunit
MMETRMQTKPLAVLISDVHFNINTLEVADKALNLAVDKANQLHVPLVIAGDLHDTKANIRGECAFAIMKTLDRCEIIPYVIRGNHCSINEKSKEHSLKFLIHHSTLVETPMDTELGFMVPYFSDPNELRAYLKTLPKGSTLIMHQGIEGSNSGEYIQDKSAITYDDVKDFRVISGHYHQRQDIKTGATGLFSYLGNPFTLGFGEANDPEKGFSILMSDGSLEFIPTNLRRHKKIGLCWDDLTNIISGLYIKDVDILWIEIQGPSDKLSKITKEYVAKSLGIVQGFRLDLVPTETKIDTAKLETTKSKSEILDQIIDQLNETDKRKANLKALWRQLSCK